MVVVTVEQDQGPVPWSIGARFAMQNLMVMCDDEHWLDEAEGLRLLAHAKQVWAPLTGDVLVTEGTERDIDPAIIEAAFAEVHSGRADLVLLGHHEPRCPFGYLVYVTGPRGARTLLQHGLPVEQRIEALLDTLAEVGLLRISRWQPSVTERPPPPLRTPPRHNVKQMLRDVSLQAMAGLCVTLAAFRWVTHTHDE